MKPYSEKSYYIISQSVPTKKEKRVYASADEEGEVELDISSSNSDKGDNPPPPSRSPRTPRTGPRINCKRDVRTTEDEELNRDSEEMERRKRQQNGQTKSNTRSKAKAPRRRKGKAPMDGPAGERKSTRLRKDK
ncbi:hypothetical protein BOTCAL_1190g00010 [Botryotinia calthae]|uniref:Uncharacterized protein n=1 Tax=Botryotinia calthae TaxID=38488 RepID=A0A4Y8CD64_9HELO|nr:hypothetical protein BOTCAL_1190g00010 [Botryotinia calthae]